MIFRNAAIALFICFLAGAIARSPKHTLVGTWKYDTQGKPSKSQTGKVLLTGKNTLTLKFGKDGDVYRNWHMGGMPAKEDVQSWGAYKMKGSIITISYTKTVLGPLLSDNAIFKQLAKKLREPHRFRVSWSQAGELELTDKKVARLTRVSL